MKRPTPPPLRRYLPSSSRHGPFEPFEPWRATYLLQIPVLDTGHITIPGRDE